MGKGKRSQRGKGEGDGEPPPPGACWGCAPHTLPSAEGRGGEAGAGSRSPPGAARPRSARCFPTGGEESPAPGAGSPLRERGRRSGWGAACVGRGRKRGKRHPASPGGVLRSVAFLAVWLPAGALRPGPPVWHGSAPLAASTGPPAESRDRAVCKAAAAARRGPSPAPRRASRDEVEGKGTPLPCAPARPEFRLPSPKIADGGRDGIAGAGGGGMGGIALARP